MATTKKTTTKKRILDDDKIIELYMNSVLEQHQTPKNVYLFCKENAIDEADFYSFFCSFDALKQSIWIKFFENAVATIQKQEDYNFYSDKNKLLTLYFTLFEILTLNRSYVLYSLKENQSGLKNLIDLKQFRNEFKSFINDIIAESAHESSLKIVYRQQKVD